MCPADKRVPQSRDVLPGLNGEPTFVGQTADVVFCLVPERTNGGSLIFWFRISNSTHDVEIRNAIMKSANIELCVISSVPKQFGTNFFD